MKRRFFTIIAGVSLLFCVASMALWAWSYLSEQRVSYTDDERGLREVAVRVTSLAGSLKLDVGTGRWSDEATARAVRSMRPDSAKSPQGFGHWSGNADPGDGMNRLMSFDYVVEVYANLPQFRAGAYSFTFPHWLPAVILGVLPGVWLSARRRKRRTFGMCASCGYDLRATPERCPECGRVPVSSEKLHPTRSGGSN